MKLVTLTEVEFETVVVVALPVVVGGVVEFDDAVVVEVDVEVDVELADVVVVVGGVDFLCPLLHAARSTRPPTARARKRRIATIVRRPVSCIGCLRSSMWRNAT